MTAGDREAIRRRASGRCEYCLLPDFAMQPEDFHVEHIIARKHASKTTEDNLAWACIFCNLYKGPNLASFDPDSGELTRLSNPRTDIGKIISDWTAPKSLDSPQSDALHAGFSK